MTASPFLAAVYSYFNRLGSFIAMSLICVIAANAFSPAIAEPVPADSSFTAQDEAINSDSEDDDDEDIGGEYEVGFDSKYFEVNLHAQLQVLYLNRAIDKTTDASELSVRRAKISFKGHIGHKAVGYGIKLAYDEEELVKLENFYLKLKLGDDYLMYLGQFKPWFLFEDRISSRYQQAVDRSAVRMNYSLGYVQGLSLTGSYHSWSWALAVHDGRGKTLKDDDITSFATCFRVNWLIAGRKGEFKEFAAWSDQSPGLMVGAGVDHEEVLPGGNVENFTTWTADASLKVHPFNLFAAVVGRNARIAEEPDPVQLGFVVQAGSFIVPDHLDLFTRWERLSHDGYAEIGNDDHEKYKSRYNQINLYVAGFNYYLKRHDAKLSADLQWVPASLYRKESSLGLIKADPDVEQIIYRIQLQFLL